METLYNRIIYHILARNSASLYGYGKIVNRNQKIGILFQAN